LELARKPSGELVINSRPAPKQKFTLDSERVIARVEIEVPEADRSRGLENTTV
jgi:hypothetical protein